MAEDDWGLWPDLQEKRFAALKNLKPDGAVPASPPCKHHRIHSNEKMVEDDWGLWADQQEKSLLVLNNLKPDGTTPIALPVPESQYAAQKLNPVFLLWKKKSINAYRGPPSQYAAKEPNPDSTSLTQKPIRAYRGPPSQYAPQESKPDSISLTQKYIGAHRGYPSQNTPQESKPDSISLTQKPMRMCVGPASQYAPQEPKAASISLMEKLLRKQLMETTVDFEIRNRDTNSPFYSVKTFEDLNLRPELLKGVYSMGFNRPSKIQERVLSLLAADPPQNLTAQSQSGTGKTIATILAALHRVDSNLNYPHVLLLSPISQLAVQTGKVAKKMSQFCPNISVRLAIRGENIERYHRITEQFLIGTPGKVFDWAVRYRFFDLKRIRLFVLDAADLMISTQGHEDQTIRIHKQLSKDCQKMLFSTAFSDELRDFAEHIAPNPVLIRLKKEEEILNNVKQYCIVCQSPEVKSEAVCSVYGSVCFGQIVIFCHIKRTAEWLAGKMSNKGLDVVLLSGEFTVEQRIIALNRFRDGKVKVLITTDAHAPVIDVERVTVVINYDIPVHFGGEADCATYLRRIGRAGRFGKTGLAINLIDSIESMTLQEQIESHFGKKIIKIDYNEMDLIEKTAKR